MSAGDTISALLQLGVALKDAFTKAQSNHTGTDWATFLGSPEFAAVNGDVTALVGKLTGTELDQALAAVRQKETALLAGATVAQLPTDKLLQYSDLLHTESLLANRKVTSMSASASALAWVVDEALPTLVTVVKVVLPLLV